MQSLSLALTRPREAACVHALAPAGGALACKRRMGEEALDDRRRRDRADVVDAPGSCQP